MSDGAADDQGDTVDAPVRVLIVDDDVDFRAMLTWQLSKADRVEVVGDAADGYEALERIQDLSPEVAVVDLMMPGMDGFELIDHMRSDHPQVVPVAYSAMANDHARTQLESIGVEMLTKSGSSDKLLEAIARLAPPSREASAAR